ncbi:MAG: hypothetical protein K8S25_02880 [Alphaproteobacteria bacterium]|nr:hypothetical protein [Alphaproteobacteria bacterium]
MGVVGVRGIVGGGTPARIQAFNTLNDPDGGIQADTVSYIWEVSPNGINGWTDATPVSVDTLTFTPGPTTGAYVRVTIVFIDVDGNLNQVVGDPVHYIVDASSTNLNLQGTAAGELIFGNGGNDLITAGAGNDFVQGGNGSDTFFATLSDGNDTYDGGNGTDTYNLSNTAAAATVNLTTGVATSAETGTDTLTSIENVVGSNGVNNITGNGGANVLRGLGGNDFLDGAGGTDTAAFSGNIASHGFSLVGSNLVVTDNRAGSPDGTDTLTSIEAVLFGTASLTLRLGTNNAAPETVNGTNADELLLGFNGNDTLNAGGGDDTLIGGAGTDTQNGGTGDDTFVATIGDGNDTIVGGNNTDTLDLSAGTVAASVNLGSVAAQLISAQFGTDTLSSIENVIGGSAGDTLTGANNVSNVIQGGGGNDTLNGGTGAGTDTAVFSGSVGSYGFSLGLGTNLVVNDNRAGSPDGQDTLSNFEAVQFGAQTFTLRQGTGGIETVTGAGGADLLLGFNGADILDGDGGADAMFGGAGADTFRFNDNDTGATALTRDIIYDFLDGTDLLDLRLIDAIAGGADQNFIFAGEIVSGSLANQRVGFFYTTIDGQDHTIIEGNIQGNAGAADFQIDLVGHITITSADFILGGGNI